MKYWHMQIHPNNKKDFSLEQFNNIVHQGLIGMGEAWENDLNQPKVFKQNLMIGDVVLLRHDGPKGLVKIVGECRNNEDTNLWFNIVRNVETLSTEGELYKRRYEIENSSKSWKEGLYLAATLQPAENCPFIKYWHKKIIKDQQMEEYINLLKSNKNLILTGAPGTGKTYLAKEIANAVAIEDEEILAKRFFKQMEVGSTIDTKNGNSKFKVDSNDGEIIHYTREATKESGAISFKEVWKKLFEKNFAPRNGGDTYSVAIALVIKESMEDVSDSESVSFVQFHPSYDYTDFVEGLRPIKKEGEKELGFELKNGIFKEFCKKAKENPNKNYVFIIDEINRAEVSKVFGELFYSIDPGYRGEKGKVKTQYNNIQTEETFFTDIADDYFYVPENVYIIGTMNDIDRSVESFDFAMRRRFAWVEVKADDRISMWGDADWKAEAEAKMKAINKIIEKDIDGLNSSYHIGPSYFLKMNLEEYSFEKLWDYHIGVILNEYLRGMPNAESDFEKLKKAYDDAK